MEPEEREEMKQAKMFGFLLLAGLLALAVGGCLKSEKAESPVTTRTIDGTIVRLEIPRADQRGAVVFNDGRVIFLDVITADELKIGATVKLTLQEGTDMKVALTKAEAIPQATPSSQITPAPSSVIPGAGK